MNKDDRFSDEQVNAFIDGELDAEEKSRVFSEAELDPELDQRLCQQRKLSELIRHAYQDPPRPNHRPAAGRRRRPLWWATAASVFILIGLGAGLLTHRHLDQKAALSATQLAGNYILHLSDGDEDSMRSTLRKAQELIESGSSDKPNQVEVVVNENGLNLLRTNITPFANEVAYLADSEVVFYACPARR